MSHAYVVLEFKGADLDIWSLLVVTREFCHDEFSL